MNHTTLCASGKAGKNMHIEKQNGDSDGATYNSLLVELNSTQMVKSYLATDTILNRL